MRKAPSAQARGTRKPDTTNIEKPVAMPKGGKTMVLSVTCRLPSRIRHTSTPKRPSRATTAEEPGANNIRFHFNGGPWPTMVTQVKTGWDFRLAVGRDKPTSGYIPESVRASRRSLAQIEMSVLPTILPEREP